MQKKDQNTKSIKNMKKMKNMKKLKGQGPNREPIKKIQPRSVLSTQN